MCLAEMISRPFAAPNASLQKKILLYRAIQSILANNLLGEQAWSNSLVFHGLQKKLAFGEI